MRARDLPKLEKALDPKQNMLAGSMKLYARIRNYKTNTVYNCSILEVLDVDVENRLIQCKVAGNRTHWFRSTLVNLDYEAKCEKIVYNGRSWEEHLENEKRVAAGRVPDVRDRFDKKIRIDSPIICLRSGAMLHDVVLGLKEGKKDWFVLQLRDNGKVIYHKDEITERVIVFPKDHRKGLGVW